MALLYLWAVAVLLGSVVVGVVVHEALHALALRASGIECSLVVLPDRSDAQGFEAMLSGSFASVEMTAIPPDCPPWRLRVAALAPLAMLLPVGAYAWLATTGALNGPSVTAMAVVGWMACALPSPADFSIVWHPREARAKLVE